MYWRGMVWEMKNGEIEYTLCTVACGMRALKSSAAISWRFLRCHKLCAWWSVWKLLRKNNLVSCCFYFLCCLTADWLKIHEAARDQWHMLCLFFFESLKLKFELFLEGIISQDLCAFIVYLEKRKSGVAA